MYTGQIRSAPLVSQNVISSKTKEAEGGYSQEARHPPQDSGGPSISPGAITVEASSPKSVYCLTDKVCLAPLLSCVVADGSLA